MPAIGGSPSLLGSTVSMGQPQPGLEPYLREHVDHYWFYGSGKVALRDGLAGLVEAGEEVLVPAYVPDALVEAFADLALDVQFYAIEETLGPDLTDLASRVSERTAAVVTVNYFGFPAPDMSAVAEVAARHDCLHVEDSAHAALSVHDGSLLGTRGDVGFTSLHKLFPIPNGACLYASEGVAGDLEPSEYAGVRETMDAADARYAVRSLAAGLANSHPSARRVADAILTNGEDSAVRDATARYEASKAQLSKLAVRVLDRIDPASIRERRRENYRAWRRGLEGVAGVWPAIGGLDDGLCPSAMPVIAEQPGEVLRALSATGVRGAQTWPRLPKPVRSDPAYGTARRLAGALVVLPVHQDLTPAAIEAVCERFGNRLETGATPRA
jgi:dTDP-4-amino-4,6-dideoxygalactose transaminase